MGKPPWSRLIPLATLGLTLGLVGKDSLGVRLGMEEGVPPTRGLDGVPLGVPGQLSSLRGERMSGVMGLLCTWASTFIA